MGQLVLVRHGQTEWSESGRHTGVTDVPLTSDGEAQAAALGQVLTPGSIELALTSPLRRARRTAELAGFPHAEVEPDLLEWDYGGYEGRTTNEISAELGRPWRVFADGVVPGDTPGELIDDVAARAATVLARVRPIVSDGGNVALFAHGHLLRILAARWLELAPEAGAILHLDAGSLSRLGFEHGVPVVDLWNVVPQVSDGVAQLCCA